MTPIFYIRKVVLNISQAELAAIAETTQATVSRWEAGELVPGLDDLARIRAHVAAAGVAWNDSWLFEVPAAAVAQAGA